jgi:hypothetical protein|eukprot:g1898.t1
MYSAKTSESDGASKYAEGVASPGAGASDSDLDDVDLDDSVDAGSSGVGGGMGLGLGGMAGLSLDSSSGGASPGGGGAAAGSSPVAINLLGMSKTSDLEISPFPTLAAQEEAIAMGEKVDVVFHLPSARTIEGQFGTGQTVQMLKAWLEKEHDVPYAGQTLVSQSSGTTMMDPLSLNDIPEIKGGEVFHVDVKHSAAGGGSYGDESFASKNERK